MCNAATRRKWAVRLFPKEQRITMDGQTDRTGRQADRQTDRQIERERGREGGRERERERER